MTTKTKSFGLFAISLIIIGLTILLATFWDSFGLGANKIPLAISVTVAFGISIAGLVLGLVEIKNNKTKKLWIGLIGNILIIIFFGLMILYSLNR